MERVPKAINQQHHRGIPQLQSLDEYLAKDSSFLSAYARALAAIACDDGALTLAEFSALTDVARETGGSAVIGASFLRAVQEPISVSKALDALREVVESAPSVDRHVAWTRSKPLFALQGFKARGFGERLGAALGLKSDHLDMSGLPPDDDQGAMQAISDQVKRVFKGRVLVNAVEELARQVGDVSLVQAARIYVRGELDRGVLHEKAMLAAEQIELGIEAYERELTQAAASEATAQSLIETASEMERQVDQRLALVEARIQQEREFFDYDIDELVHDAGNALEVAVTDRLSTDQWKKSDVWLSIARTQYGKEMERRIERLLRRKEESLRFLKEDLRLFQNDVRLTHASLGRRQHHSELAKLMPSMRIGTRAWGAADSAATVALVSSGAATAGLAAVGYFAGVAVVLPLVSVAAPYIGGAALLGGLFKWLHDSEKLKKSEIREKREAFEKQLKLRLEAAQASFNQQFEEVGQAFRASAVYLVLPIKLEAEAAGRLIGMQKRVAERAVGQYEVALRQLRSELDGI